MKKILLGIVMMILMISSVSAITTNLEIQNKTFDFFHQEQYLQNETPKFFVSVLESGYWSVPGFPSFGSSFTFRLFNSSNEMVGSWQTQLMFEPDGNITASIIKSYFFIESYCQSNDPICDYYKDDDGYYHSRYYSQSLAPDTSFFGLLIGVPLDVGEYFIGFTTSPAVLNPNYGDNCFEHGSPVGTYYCEIYRFEVIEEYPEEPEEQSLNEGIIYDFRFKDSYRINEDIDIYYDLFMNNTHDVSARIQKADNSSINYTFHTYNQTVNITYTLTNKLAEIELNETGKYYIIATGLTGEEYFGSFEVKHRLPSIVSVSLGIIALITLIGGIFLSPLLLIGILTLSGTITMVMFDYMYAIENWIVISVLVIIILMLTVLLQRVLYELLS